MRIVVVGAGIVGAAIASAAAGRGAAVTLIDQASPGAGATGASFAWIGDSGSWPGGAADLRETALPAWHRLERETPGVRVRWSGALTWDDPAAASGFPAPAPTVVPVDRARVAALEPNLRHPPSHALWHSAHGAVDPLAVTTALVRTAHQRGAQIRPTLTVTSVRHDGSRVTGVV